MDDPNTGLAFREMGLAHVLAEHVLAVPLNQRSYAWTDDEVQRLLDDLYRAFRDGEAIYFLGAIVLTRDSAGEWQIADGQQRLATMAILISAVRDYLIELGDQAGADKYQTMYLLNYNVRKKTSTAQLNLNFEDHDFFLTEILNAPKDRATYPGRQFDSHLRLSEAAGLAHKHVRDTQE